jgi:hypothetical protein
MYVVALLRDGPFGGETGEIPYLPEHLRVAKDEHGETWWWDEAKRRWPEKAARYTLAESVNAPAVYVYDGVGDGSSRPHEYEEAPFNRPKVTATAEWVRFYAFGDGEPPRELEWINPWNGLVTSGYRTVRDQRLLDLEPSDAWARSNHAPPCPSCGHRHPWGDHCPGPRHPSCGSWIEPLEE